MNKRYLAYAMAMLAVPLVINTRTRMSIVEWQKLYHIQELTPDLQMAMASCIYYLSQKAPSEATFSKELGTVLNAFPNSPTYFRQGLIKLFELSFIQAYEASQLGKPSYYHWKLALLRFYTPLWTLLGPAGYFNYGPLDSVHEPKSLPHPQNF